MATAKKLPSGSWRCQVYSHTETVRQPDGTTKQKRIYKSFTCDDPSARGKRTCERMAAEWAADKETYISQHKSDYSDMTLSEAVDRYIESRIAMGRSPTTIQEYRCTQRNAFPDLMGLRLRDINEAILQDAVYAEAHRPANGSRSGGKTLSAKRLRNEWGLVSSTLHKYAKHIDTDEIELPKAEPRYRELPAPKDVCRIVRGTDIELAVLLAMWLSFSMSEVLGLTKSKSISGDYITIREVVVTVDGVQCRKDMAKNPTRNRRHRIPAYIKGLIDHVDGDVLVPMSAHTVYMHWIRLQQQHGMDCITFHDLRHINASVMALLRIPDKYAQERGGWKTDAVMKQVYMQTFSEERERVDDIIDSYFDSIMQHDVQHDF